MQIQFGLDGAVVSADYSGSVTDPSKDTKYSFAEKLAAAATVSPEVARTSPQQLQIDKQTKHIQFLEAKAAAVRGYDKDGKPQYVESADERAKLTKIAAMECYETELRDYPHPRSSRALRERAAYWGSHVGRLAAEPLVILREVT